MDITTWTEAYEAYDEMLDDVYGEWDLGIVMLSASRALRFTDPIAYRTGLNDWLDAEGIDSDDLEGDDNR